MNISLATDAPPEGRPLRPALTLPVVAVLALAALLSLMGFQLALKLPGGQGIEDFLGWTNPDSIKAALWHWRASPWNAATPADGGRWHVEAAYLLVDTWLFMPLYAVFLLLLAHSLIELLKRSARLEARSLLGWRMRKYLLRITLLPVLALVLADVLENYGGAARSGVPAVVFFASLGAAAALGVAMWVAATDGAASRRRRAWVVMGAAFLAGAALAGRGFFGVLEASECVDTEAGKACLGWAATAHTTKPWLALWALATVAGAWALWLFGADLKADHIPVRRVPNGRASRAALRSGMGAIVWRTRYVLVLLGVFAGLTLGLDQGRDVLLALAHWSAENASTEEQALVAPWGLRAFMAFMVGLAVGLFVHSTWLWARLCCRIRRQRDGAGDTPYKLAGMSEDDAAAQERVRTRLGLFARTWARALSLVPMVCVYALVAFAISDAINAAAAFAQAGPLPDELRHTVLTLCAIGALAVGLGAAFLMMRRVLSLKSEADYFNSNEGLYELLQGADESDQVPVPAAGGSLWSRLRRQVWRFLRWLHFAQPWLRPRTLPLVALGGVLLLRAAMAWQPELMSTAPAALALVTLTLVWWMGVAGALTLAEVRLGRPYGLFLVVIIGMLSALPLGLADNHVLPLTTAALDASALQALRWQGLALVAWLAFLCGALWWLFTAEQVPWKVLNRLGAWLRPGAVVAGVLLALLALRLADRAPPTSRLASTEVPTLAEEAQQWVQGLKPGEEPVYLVASEGGGIRSAYWTAQVLSQLHGLDKEFSQRTFAMSGVSGGAVGLAAYSACLRELAGSSTHKNMAECVRKGFAKVDPLSPLLAAWFFEDVLARALPVPMASDAKQTNPWYCRHPACGHLSRAAGFEREWVRALPGLATPLAAAGRQGGQQGGRWEPHLLLNGTWVESGELASVASVVVAPGPFPGARDVQRRLGAELSLVGGAHVAARFPFINPLAAVQPASGAAGYAARAVSAADLPDTGKVDGHLGDGGYFDNSATVALLPVWRALHAAMEAAQKFRPIEVLLIRNGQAPRGCDRPAKNGPACACILPARQVLTRADTLALPSQSRSWALYADVLGPAITVLNVSGIGAHGRHAPANLQAEAAALPASAAASTPTVLRPIDQMNLGALVPLGWYLSPTARRALEEQAEAFADQWWSPPPPPD